MVTLKRGGTLWPTWARYPHWKSLLIGWHGPTLAVADRRGVARGMEVYRSDVMTRYQTPKRPGHRPAGWWYFDAPVECRIDPLAEPDPDHYETQPQRLLEMHERGLLTLDRGTGRHPATPAERRG